MTQFSFFINTLDGRRRQYYVDYVDYEASTMSRREFSLWTFWNSLRILNFTRKIYISIWKTKVHVISINRKWSGYENSTNYSTHQSLAQFLPENLSMNDIQKSFWIFIQHDLLQFCFQTSSEVFILNRQHNF